MGSGPEATLKEPAMWTMAPAQRAVLGYAAEHSLGSVAYGVSSERGRPCCKLVPPTNQPARQLAKQLNVVQSGSLFVLALPLVGESKPKSALAALSVLPVVFVLLQGESWHVGGVGWRLGVLGIRDASIQWERWQH